MKLQKNQKIIKEPISLPELSQAEKDRDLQRFCDNFEQIQKHANCIRNTPELFFCVLPAAAVNLAFLGSYPLPLGVLLQLWQEGLLIDVCDLCQGNRYIFSASGSPLSGRNLCRGFCRTCHTLSTKSLPSFRPIMQALQKVKENQNKQTILRTKGQHFSFQHGLTGTPADDQILEEGVNPVRLEALLRRLQK